MSESSTMPVRDSAGDVNPHVLVELEQPAERQIVLASCTPDQLADLAERLRQLKSEREQLVKHVSETIGEVEHELFSRLAPGEVVMADSTGRFAYSGLVSGGKASVRTEALDEHAHELPDDLRPQPTTRYPGVSELRKAKRRLRQLGLSLATFIDEPPKVRGLRWRTLKDEDESDG
jgi:hypothetical protein